MLFREIIGGIFASENNVKHSRKNTVLKILKQAVYIVTIVLLNVKKPTSQTIGTKQI
jgi:hypothetical protein